MFEDIRGSSKWKCVEKIDKGWSTDQKYKIITNSGEVLLLRISSIDNFEDKKKEYEIITKFSKLGFKMSMPIQFGVCDAGQHVYMLLSWVEGVDVEEMLPMLSTEAQYQLGYQAGEILRKIHSMDVDDSDIPSKTKVEKKLRQLSLYEASDVRIENDENIIRFVKENIEYIWEQKPTYLHGDFHPGNLIYTPEGSIGVIDFNRWEVGDPYEAFYKLQCFGREISIPYCIGQIDAYFDKQVPEEFWRALAVYVAHASLYSIKWAEKFGQEEIDGMRKRCLQALEDYDYFKRIVPGWYNV